MWSPTHFFAPPSLKLRRGFEVQAFVRRRSVPPKLKHEAKYLSAGEQIIMFYVYIPRSQRDGSYYTGFTNDFEDRIKEHNSGIGDYSSTKFPFELVWHCCFREKAKAIQFEKYLKFGSGFAFARKRLV